MFPEGMDMSALLAQAQQMQAQLQSAQEELANSSFTGTSGGGLVEATMSGQGELTGLVIQPAAIDPEDADGLADLVMAAVRDAASQVQSAAADIMPDVPDMGALGF
ncbi:MAG TPA: YbaB/EbfC family nucleoid-associated protein [Candidatus Luteococcus avicola]|uniref:Nucleoid-associated protein ACFP57_07665 n=1 Tax=Luteococcus sanguinis TaxID=174038 RepID=A0ABW1X258_9ACTN|nr:YbaB/EbfC family nucleoid-associated protein [Candidatus Luteococcus avicola]